MLGREDDLGPERRQQQPYASSAPRREPEAGLQEAFNRRIGLTSLLTTSFLALGFGVVLVVAAVTGDFAWGGLAVTVMAAGSNGAAWYGWRRKLASASWTGLFLGVTSMALSQSLA